MDAPPRNPERELPRNPDKYAVPSSSKGAYPYLQTDADKNGSTPSSDRPQRQSSFLNLALTPLRSQSKQIRQSYENLVALANAQEALKQTRRAVWRDRGEPPVELTSVEECFEHAMRGGARAGGLGFGIRSGVNIFILLFKIFRTPKSFRFSLIRHALLGPDSFKFAAMLGTFVTLYKLLLNALPLFSMPSQLADFSPPLPWGVSAPATPPGYDSDPNWSLMTPKHEKKKFDLEAGRKEDEEIDPANVKTKLSRQAKVHEVWIRKKGRRWHAALAGAIAGGLAVLWETKERRLGIAQQLFVRGLQGSWNAFSAKKGIKVPFGSVIVFSMCCGQIMYAWLLRPDTIPRSYSLWISEAAKVLHPTVLVNRGFAREGRADPKYMRDIMDWSQTTPSNRTLIAQAIEATANGPIERRFSSCAETHPWLDSCTYVQIERFLEVFKWMFPIYGALHFVPALLFKRKEWVKDAPGMLWRNLLGTGRSSAFLGVFVIIYQTYFCARYNLYEWLVSLKSDSEALKLFRSKIMGHKYTLWMVGAMCGLSLLVEAPKRRAELAMYVMPKALESAWVSARGRGWVTGGGRVGQSLLCAAGMGMVMNDPQHLSGLVRRILYQFIGPN
ncbi:SubName: Full=Uncharacterized protein {ECO:0000313/EMBL:CCA72720.1} [Serendipita indica DSM 11827]|uniref:Transmembrane protein 135 N-terminal domain-containing protein n=1 Tax=Serendipita indica (strain DSM 11827) TaxID=1109443 RepID=G4TN16_SERID|nr:SubName: Full=Uncharacterized protein {ECO:0000313/EMBL:CCA72720.1} [Serendipita indica DSM 11827]CCA72720.1 hypothetical protein PIIN_06657 [Serendipita indica DSM 11827]